MFCQRRLQQSCLELSKEARRVSQPISQTGVVTLRHGYMRCISTQRDRRTRPDSGSIFSSSEPAWKHIFGEDEKLSRHARPNPLANARRQSMTENEKSIIRELLDEVLQAKQSQSPAVLAEAETLYESTGATGTRKIKKRLSSAIEVALDEMKQTIEDRPTKVALLEWAQTHIFPSLGQHTPPSSKQTPGVPALHVLEHIIPIVMKNLRKRFGDPNLALFIFRAVRNHSTSSFVHGCTAPTYAELITLLWDSFRDLQGIRDALEDMLVNSVEVSGGVERAAERACREAMDDKLWLDRTEEGDQVAMSTLSSISELLMDLAAAKEKHAGRLARFKRKNIQISDEFEEIVDKD